MLKTSLASLSALVSLAVVAPASAQEMTGPIAQPPMPTPAGYSNNGLMQARALAGPSDRQRMATVAACVVRRSVTRTKAFLATFPGSADAIRVAGSLGDDNCLNRAGGVAYTVEQLRGVLYNDLYRREFAAAGAADFAAVAPLDYGQGMTAASTPNFATMVAQRTLFDCAVRADPAGARTFVLAPVGGEAETAALRAMVPALQQCTPAGQSLDINVGRARDLAAEALYRLTVASRGG